MQRRGKRESRAFYMNIAPTRLIHNCMPVIFDKANIRRSLAEIRLWLNGSGAELLRAAAEDRVCLWPVSRRIDTTGDSDDGLKPVDDVTA